MDSITQLEEELEKAAARGGKYYRRVATGNPKRPYKYFYTQAAWAKHDKEKHLHGPDIRAKREGVKSLRHWTMGKEHGHTDTQKKHTAGSTRTTSMGDEIHNYKSERQTLHSKIVEDFHAHVPSVPENKKPVAVVMMGGSASGKGTIIRHVMQGERREGVPQDFVNVNADDVKEKLPEYKAMLDLGKHSSGKTVSAKDAAWLSHEESSDVSKMVLEKAMSGRKNLVMDGTGKNAEKYAEKIQQLKAMSYHVQVMMPHIQMEEAQARAKQRAERSGRYVPDEFVQQAHHVIPGNFRKVAAAAHDAVLFDNSRPPPRAVWSNSGAGERVHDASFMQSFDQNAQSKHATARAKGWMKAMTHDLRKGEDDKPDSKPPSVTLEQMLERFNTNHGTADDNASMMDDFKEEWAAHLKGESTEKSEDALDMLGEELEKSGGHKYIKRIPKKGGGYDYVYEHVAKPKRGSMGVEPQSSSRVGPVRTPVEPEKIKQLRAEDAKNAERQRKNAAETRAADQAHLASLKEKKSFKNPFGKMKGKAMESGGGLNAGALVGARAGKLTTADYPAIGVNPDSKMLGHATDAIASLGKLTQAMAGKMAMAGDLPQPTTPTVRGKDETFESGDTAESAYMGRTKKSEEPMTQAMPDPDTMSKGLYSFYDYNNKMGTLPDNHLPDLIGALIEEAYEHEKNETVHNEMNLEGQDKVQSLVQAVYNEICKCAQHNKNIRRAIDNLNIDVAYVRRVMNEQGMVQVKDENYAADKTAQTAGFHPTSMALSADSMSVRSEMGGGSSTRLSKSTPDYVQLKEDRPEPALVLNEAHQLRNARLRGEDTIIKANVDPSCVIHGRDMLKMERFSGEQKACTCPR